MDTIPSKPSKFTDCPVKYKFIYNSGAMQLSSFHEIHNHSLTFEVKVLTVNMLEDIKTFSKSTKVFTIKEFLEKKNSA